MLGVGAAVDRHEPVYWGTFTEHSCVQARFGCESFGTWVSDDGSIVKHDIALDGTPGADGVVRASYMPTGFANDADNDIVHTSQLPGARYWLPWALFVGGVAAIVFQVRSRPLRRRRLLGRRSGARGR